MEEVMRRIQERMGHSPKLEIEEFENWAGTYNADVISCSPTSKEEIQKVIEAAKEEGVKLRCAGSQHSWSPVFSDDRQLLLKLGKVRSDYGHGAKIRISNVSDPDISKHAWNLWNRMHKSLWYCLHVDWLYTRKTKSYRLSFLKTFVCLKHSAPFFYFYQFNCYRYIHVCVEIN